MDSSSSSRDILTILLSNCQDLFPYGEGSVHFSNILLLFELPTSGLSVAILCLVLLLVASSLLSGSEVAFFSLSSSQLKELDTTNQNAAQRIRNLLGTPRYLLATILIANNCFNVAIVIISYYVVSYFIDFAVSPIIGFSVNVVGVTFLLVLFGEALPKIYANKKNTVLATFMAVPLSFMKKCLKPVSFLLVSSTRLIEKRLQKRNDEKYLSIDEINKAIDLTTNKETTNQEIRILKGVAKFGDIAVKQIMKARVDITAIEATADYHELLMLIKGSEYSRIPVYEENLDNIVGLLYVKDLLKYIDSPSDFNWLSLVRQPLFVPDTKKIDDLLEEMQDLHTHLAIVVDEYGGTLGIITLEDILEEVIGEIKDEFDEPQEITYQRIDRNNYIFDGKTLLNDITKVLGVSPDRFDDVKGDSDSLAGLLLELAGKIPEKNEQIRHENFLFTVLSISKNRIDKVKITLLENENVEEADVE